MSPTECGAPEPAPSGLSAVWSQSESEMESESDSGLESDRAESEAGASDW